MTKIKGQDIQVARRHSFQTGEAIIHGAGLAMACLISY